MLRHRMTPYGTLVIRNTEKKDEGAYGCLASNQAGTDAMTSVLTYIGKVVNRNAHNHKISVEMTK